MKSRSNAKGGHTLSGRNGESMFSNDLRRRTREKRFACEPLENDDRQRVNVAGGGWSIVCKAFRGHIAWRPYACLCILLPCLLDKSHCTKVTDEDFVAITQQQVFRFHILVNDTMSMHEGERFSDLPGVVHDHSPCKPFNIASWRVQCRINTPGGNAVTFVTEEMRHTSHS